MIADCTTGLGADACVLCKIGGGMIEAAMGEGDLQRGSSWLESENRSRLLEEARENRDLVSAILALEHSGMSGSTLADVPLHVAWNAGVIA